MDRLDKIYLSGYFGDPPNMSFEGLSLSFSSNGTNGFASKFTVDSTCVVPSPFCCPGDNLAINGDFESGNTGFSNDYLYQQSITANSIVPGQYGIVNGLQAGTISATWSPIVDPSTCSGSSGNVLIINGENGGGSTPPALSNSIAPAKVIWEQTIAVQDWRGYKFCFDAKNLNQCGFNVLPKLEIQFSMPFGNINETISVNGGACDWQRISQHLDLWGYGSSLNIKILLDQSDFGDGNDVAIDNIALIPLDQCPITSALFDLQTNTPHPTSPAHFSVSGEADIAPPCDAVWWEVCRYDPVTDDCIAGTKLGGAWWTTITDFPGYNGSTNISGSNPGFFQFGHFYRITRGTWGDCHSWKSSSKIISAPSPFAKLISYESTEFKNKKSQIVKSFNKNLQLRKRDDIPE